MAESSFKPRKRGTTKLLKRRPRVAKTSRIAPDRIFEIGTGFMKSKTLLSAIELGLFTELATKPLTLDELSRRLRLHPRSARDFLDALVGMGLLRRRNGIYANSADAAAFLDRNRKTYVGGLFEMCNRRLYPFWGKLTEALHSGEPQNEVRTGEDVFAALYADPQRLRMFLGAMSGFSAAIGRDVAVKFPWDRYSSLIDVGCAQGALVAEVARKHRRLVGGGFDLPPVGPIFDEYIESQGLQKRLRFHPGNFFTDPIPEADVLIMGHILHDWNLEQKRALVKKAYDTLAKGGAFIVYETMIDDARTKNLQGLLMSLNMLIETPTGSDFTWGDCRGWMRDAGFKRTQVRSLVAHHWMVVGIK